MEGIFNPEKMAQMVWDIAKDYAATSNQIMKTSADQFEKSMDMMLKQGFVAQEEGKKVLNDWTNRAKQAQQQYWNLMDENLKKMEAFFSPNGNKKTSK